MIGLGLIWLGLMMCYGVIMDNIQQCYAYLFKKELISRPPSLLIQYFRIVRIGLKLLMRGLYAF